MNSGPDPDPAVVKSYRQCNKLPWVDLDRSWYVQIALTSFQGLNGWAVRALLVEWVTWGWHEVHDVTTRGRVIIQLALLFRGSPEWALRGRHREANRAHPIYRERLIEKKQWAVCQLFQFGVLTFVWNLRLHPARLVSSVLCPTLQSPVIS